jgi:hypothetical protein
MGRYSKISHSNPLKNTAQVKSLNKLIHCHIHIDGTDEFID